jgi:hypothetical protein
MAVVARYIWGETEHGYGWNAWPGCGLSIERVGQSGFWAVYEKDGSQLCVCTSYRGAQRVVARFRRAELAKFDPQGGMDFALLEEGPDGVTYSGYAERPEYLSDHGKVFPTREQAEAFVRSREHTVSNGLLRC